MPLCMLEAVEGMLCLLGLLEVMRCGLELLDVVLYVLGVPEGAMYAALYARGRGSCAPCAVDDGGDATAVWVSLNVALGYPGYTTSRLQRTLFGLLSKYCLVSDHVFLCLI